MGKKPTKIFLDDIYVIACPKVEVTYNEEERKKKERDNKRAFLKVRFGQRGES